MKALRAFQDRFWAKKRRGVPFIFYANGGIGDELMFTAVTAAARRAGKPISIIQRYPEVWKNNHDPLFIDSDVDRWFYAKKRGWIRTNIIHLSCALGRGSHLADQMAAHAGISLPKNWRPHFPHDGDVPRDENLIVVQNSCSGALYSATTKEWELKKWKELLNRLVSHNIKYQILQVGTIKDPLLPHVKDLRGRTTLYEAATLLKKASLFLGLESGLQHLAAAMHTPSIIIFGGRSRPSETGYPFNYNITRSPACVGCGLNSDCPHGMLCMDIPVKEVEDAVQSLMENQSL